MSTSRSWRWLLLGVPSKWDRTEREVVDDEHLGAIGEQRADQVVADQPSPAGYQHASRHESSSVTHLGHKALAGANTGEIVNAAYLPYDWVVTAR
jgi:hypothetical protein